MTPVLGRFPGPMGRSVTGHEERFPPPRPSGRYRFREATFAGTRGNEEFAPTQDLAFGADEFPGSTLADLHIQLALASRVSPSYMWRMRYRVTRVYLETAVKHLVR
jgi:hypothetical protein